MFYANGDKFEGEWQADVRHGYGTIIFGSFGTCCLRRSDSHVFTVNGDRFEGRFVNDVREGRGTFFFVAKGQRLDGEWVDDRPRCGQLSDIAPIAHPLPAVRSVLLSIPLSSLPTAWCSLDLPSRTKYWHDRWRRPSTNATSGSRCPSPVRESH
jgi:hypothetical protein